MNTNVHFLSATPVLASLDINRSVDFFVSKLGFGKVYADQGAYGIVSAGPVHIHFWACSDRRISEATSCRICVQGIEALYELCSKERIIHQKAVLEQKPWGSMEFAIVDLDGNLVTFYESTSASQAFEPTPAARLN